jgi:hypothetical protein
MGQATLCLLLQALADFAENWKVKKVADVQ